MGRGAVKAHQQAARAKRLANTTAKAKAGVDSVEPEPTASTEAPTAVPVHLRASNPPPSSNSRTKSNTAAVVMQPVPVTSAFEEEGPVATTHAQRPVRQSAKAVKTLLLEIQSNEAGDDEDEPGQTTAVDDLPVDGEFADDDDEENDDYNEADDQDEDEKFKDNSKVLKSVHKLSQAAKQGSKTAKKVAKDITSSESSDEELTSFTYTMEILSVSKQLRHPEVISSSITLYDLRQKIAGTLDIFPDNLHPQYRFSTDSKDTLPCDLVTYGHYNVLLRLLRERAVPPRTASGQPSKRKMKPFTLQVFIKGDSPFAASAEAKNSASSKSKGGGAIAEKDQSKTPAAIYHEQRIAARTALTDFWTCEMHSLPSKSALCFKNPTTGLCHPITENNANLWASLHIKDPKAYPIDQKPAEVNVLCNAARGRPLVKPGETNEPVGPFPYGYYPPPFVSPTMYYSFPHAHGVVPPQLAGLPMLPPNGFPLPQQPIPLSSAEPMASQSFKYPQIPEWIEYCDCHPDRSRANLVALIPKFQEQGFRFINQLTGTRVTVDKLSEWLSVRPGTADLIVGYAEEDCRRVVAGTFTMGLPSGLVAPAGKN